MVVRFDSARSAEPPQSSGSTPASALMTLPDAARVDSSVPPSNTGSACSMSSGSSPASSRSSRTFLLGVRRGPRVEPDLPLGVCRGAALDRRSRVCASTSSATTKFFSGSKPSTSFVAASSSAPSAEPWILPVFCLPGLGQPMIVFRMMIDGLDGLGLGRLDGGVQFCDVFDVLAGLLPVDGLHLPAVRLVARGDVFGEGDVRVVFDRDLVRVVDHDQVAELLVAGER